MQPGNTSPLCQRNSFFPMEHRQPSIRCVQRLTSVIYPYAELSNLDHYRGPPRKTFEQSLTVVDDFVKFFMAWGERTRQRTTQGTDHIISYGTRRSFNIMHESSNSQTYLTS